MPGYAYGPPYSRDALSTFSADSRNPIGSALFLQKVLAAAFVLNIVVILFDRTRRTVVDRVLRTAVVAEPTHPMYPGTKVSVADPH